MNRLINSQWLWICLLLAVLLLTGCISVLAKDEENNVVWKGSRAYAKRVESFKIKPSEAAKMVSEEMRKPGAVQLRRGGIFAEAEFIAGRWYWFGIATKTEIYAAGYYVNGDTGKIEYRESDRTVKSGARKLPKETWSKITSLAEAKADH
jgi:hypothetical protein